MKLLPLLGLVCLAGAGAFPAAGQAAEKNMNVLASLRTGHPRLICTDTDLARVRRMIDKEPAARAAYEALRQGAEKILPAPPVVHKLAGPRLLDQSRRCLYRVTTLAMLYRLDGDKKWAERARQEMLAAAAFPDWNPSHFLDTAEMTNALALGYDWLYDFLGADRDAIRAAIVEKGLKPALKVYEGDGWWAACSHNWNQVCNGGIGMGALAIADAEPEIAERILQYGLKSIRLPMARFAPDGGWDEGPGYWSYATAYNVYFLAALETALGTDFGLGKLPDFDRTGLFRIYFSGPINRTFNYADAGDGVDGAPQMFWMARRFNRPIYAWQERQFINRPSIWDLIWFDPRGKGPNAERLPLHALFRNVNVAFFRSAWEDPNAIFIGFKGGDNRANHSHLDLGTFVLDALGQRWALDLSSDNYNLPGYFGKERWTYYRLRTEGHNTLVINGENQSPRAAAPIRHFNAAANDGSAVADLTAGYATEAKRVWRGIALRDRRTVLVQDEVETERPAAIDWYLHTAAKVTTAGDTATLSLGDAQMTAHILSPAGARFEILSANPPKPQAQQPQVSKLAIRLTGCTGLTRIAVQLTPHRADEAAPMESITLRPLAEWPGKETGAH